MAKPHPLWSQPLASCSLLICILHIMTWIIRAEQSSVELASCGELQCAHSNVCHTTLLNNTQAGHSRCLCRGRWAGLRCQARIRVHVASVSTDSVTLRFEGHGPPDWNADLSLEELFIQELAVTFWNLNKSEDCNVLSISEPKDFDIRVDALERHQDFLFCVGNGPSDLCSSLSDATNDTSLAKDPNCVKLRTKLKEDAPLDVGLIVVPIASVIFIIVLILLFYFKRNSLVVHFFLHFCCCRAWYCCRKRCIRRRIQKMRKQQHQQQQQRDSYGNLLPHHHDAPLDDTMTFDLSVASASLSSSALGNRSSIKSDSCRSARSMDSDNTIPPAYQDESCMPSNLPLDDGEATLTPRSLSRETFPMPKHHRLSDPSFPSFSNPDRHSWEGLLSRQESPWCPNEIHSDFEDPDLYRRTHFYPGDRNRPETVRSASGVPSQLSWTAGGPTSLAGTFPQKAKTLPSDMRTLPPHFHQPTRSSTIIGIRRRLSDTFFRPIDPTTESYTDASSLQNDTLESNYNNPSNYVNLPPYLATSPRRREEQFGLSSTLPRAHAKKGTARGSPHELPKELPEIYGPYVGLNTHEPSKFDWLTLPPRVPDVPQTSLPSDAAEDSKSTVSNSKEDHVPVKRVKTLIGHFERSLPFLKPSSSSRPNSVHWEDEIRDLTSPLAVERARKKKKRPRPWSLPVGLEIRPVASRGSQRRGKKPIFEGHPSLHILPPFTTDEEEEDEEGGKKEDGTKARMFPPFDVGRPSEKVNSSTPCLKKIKENGGFISSFEDDSRNLVTPFSCKDFEDEDDDNDDNEHYVDNNGVKQYVTSGRDCNA